MPLLLRLTDRSRIETGRGKCARERWARYSWTNGYGLRRKVEALPLVGGLALHAAIEPILGYARDRHLVPSEDELVALATPAIDAFGDKIRRRGVELTGSESDEGIAAFADEQCALVAGLAWAFGLYELPMILERGRVIEIEREDVYVLGCTCGLGDGVGTPEEHDSRECAGTGFQCRPDFLTDDVGNVLTYHDLKSTGWANKQWADAWLYKIQVHAGALGASARLERRVDQVVIHGLYKGQRRGQYNPETGKYDLNSGEKKQNSPFCYAYHRAPNPPLWDGGWDWDRPKGKGAREWEKTPTASYDGGHWAWIRQLPPEVIVAQLLTVGPFPLNPAMLEAFLRQTAEEEHRWYQVELDLYEELGRCGNDWTAPNYQALLDKLVPQSFDCLRFGKPCQLVDVCHRAPGWGEPLSHGYELRRPHHAPELEAAIAKGLILPEAVDEDEDAGED